MRSLLLLSMLLATVLLVACGDNGDDDEAMPAAPSSDAAPASSDEDEDSPSPGTAPASGAVGQLTLDGQTHAVTQVCRFEPFDDGPDDLDLIGVGQGFEVFVYIASSTGLEMHELSVQGREIGVYAGLASTFGDEWLDEDDNELDGPPFEVRGDRVQGGMTVTDQAGGAGSLRADVDLPVPAEIEEC
jgi:hypothetical protein